MKYCVKCGAELCDEAVVCPKCGCIVDGRLVEKDFSEKIEEKKVEPVVATEKRYHTWLSLVLGILSLIYAALLFHQYYWTKRLFTAILCMSDAIIPIAFVVSMIQLKSPKKVMPILGIVFSGIAYTAHIFLVLFVGWAYVLYF